LFTVLSFQFVLFHSDSDGSRSSRSSGGSHKGRQLKSVNAMKVSRADDSDSDNEGGHRKGLTEEEQAAVSAEDDWQRALAEMKKQYGTKDPNTITAPKVHVKRQNIRSMEVSTRMFSCLII
jgi:hypothetical protein